MKALHGRPLAIVEGRTTLPDEDVRAYRDFYAQQGFFVPPLLPAGKRRQQLACRHRGPVLDVRFCELCPQTKDVVEVSVYVCGLHTQCTLRNVLNDVRACSHCTDRTP